MKSIETNQVSKINEARKEESQRIINEVKNILPPPQIERFFNGGAQRFVIEVKKIVHKESVNKS
jgi:hypothetical protein